MTTNSNHRAIPAGEQDERSASEIIADALLPYVRGSQNAATLAHAVIDALAAAPAAGTKAEHYDEVKATLQGAHRIMEGVSEIERKVGPIGSHARGYTHKITAALRHLDALYAAAPAAGDAQDAALPPKMPKHESYGGERPSNDSYQEGYADGWNDAIDAAKAAQQGEGGAA